MIVIGIDPGQKGAICALTDNQVIIHDMPLHIEKKTVKGKLDQPDTQKVVRRIDRKGFRDLLQGFFKLDFQVHVCIEKITGFGTIMRGRKGVRTAGDFPFARDYGALLGVLDCLDVSYSEVAPVSWMSKIKGKEFAGKEGSIAQALALYPQADLVRTNGRVNHDGRAEALLLAHYGKEVIFNGNTGSPMRFLYEHM